MRALLFVSTTPFTVGRERAKEDVLTDVLEGVDEAIQEIAEPLVAKRETVIEHRQDLIRKREEADEALRRIDRALRPLRPDLFDAKPKPRASNNGQRRIGVRTAAGTATGTGITIERCEPFVKEIEAQIASGAEYVTQIGVYREIPGGEQTKASAAFKYLRKIGYLRKGGIVDRRETWYMDDAGAYAKALEEARNDA